MTLSSSFSDLSEEQAKLLKFEAPPLTGRAAKDAPGMVNTGALSSPNGRLRLDGWRLHPADRAGGARRRVAFVVHKFPPESLGGTELYCWGLARALATEGHQAHIFYPTPSLVEGEERVEREGVHLWSVPLPPTREHEDPVSQYWHTFRDLGIEAAFQRFLDEVQPELVHFQHVQGVSARLIELAAPLPRIVTLHDYWYFCANSQLIRPDRRPCEGPSAGCHNCVDCATERADLQWMRPLRPLVALPFAYRNRYLRHLADEVDLFLAPSAFLRQKYVEHGFPAEKIVVVENGLDVDKLAPTSQPTIAQPAVRPHFGFLGSLAWQKGVHVLIEAFNRLDERASLTIYGSEHTFPEYAAELKRLARHPNIRFAGVVEPRQVGEALRQIDCLVVPSLWYENSPLVIQEAYGVGVPVVASRLGALPEKVKEDSTGRLFSPGDVDDLAAVLQDLVTHPQLLAEMSERIVPAPSMAVHAAYLAQVYEGVVVGDRGLGTGD
ncbi:MAG: glycosyltransferase family 4 protein [Caldilineaceae bacterium]